VRSGQTIEMLLVALIEDVERERAIEEFLQGVKVAVLVDLIGQSQRESWVGRVLCILTIRLESPLGGLVDASLERV